MECDPARVYHIYKKFTFSGINISTVRGMKLRFMLIVTKVVDADFIVEKSESLYKYNNIV